MGGYDWLLNKSSPFPRRPERPTLPKELWELNIISEDETKSSGLPKFFCRERAELKSQRSKESVEVDSLKRKSNDDDAHDAPIKKVKLSDDEPKNKDKDKDILVETVLSFISESDLKEIVTKALDDSVAGPILRKELMASIESTMIYARNKARDISMNVQKKASQAIDKVESEAMEINGMESGSAWPDALCVHVRKIKDLAEQGPLVDGPELAWEALIYVADLCILPGDGDELRLEDGEEVCDEFHDDVDDVMLHICKLQEANGRKTWLQDPARKEEIWKLQDKPWAPLDFEGKNCTYRYQKTLKFLEYVGADN